jgi:hypothetical protein
MAHSHKVSNTYPHHKVTIPLSRIDRTTEIVIVNNQQSRSFAVSQSRSPDNMQQNLHSVGWNLLCIPCVPSLLTHREGFVQELSFFAGGNGEESRQF